MNPIKNYLSLVKFSHTIFAMPFALIGFVVGLRYNWIEHITIQHVWTKFFLVILCMVTADAISWHLIDIWIDILIS